MKLKLARPCIFPRYHRSNMRPIERPLILENQVARYFILYNHKLFNWMSNARHLLVIDWIRTYDLVWIME